RCAAAAAQGGASLGRGGSDSSAHGQGRLSMPPVRPVARGLQGRDDRAPAGRRARRDPLRRNRAARGRSALGPRAERRPEVRAELPPGGVRPARRAPLLTRRLAWERSLSVAAGAAAGSWQAQAETRGAALIMG